MNADARDLALLCPGVERRGFDSQLCSKVFDRQEHSDTNRGSLTTPPSPHDAPACLPASDPACMPSGCEPARQSRDQAFLVPSPGAPPASRLSPANAPARLLLRRPTLCCEGWGYNILMKKKEADMAIHGSQGSLKLVRQPKPRHEYAVPRYRVTLVRENRAVPPSSPLNSSVAAAAVLRPLFEGLDREQFLVCGLDAKHRIIGVNLVSIGSLTLALVHPREVFKPLILMNAAAWIGVHNHPSSDPTPSQEDRVLTSRLKQGAEVFGITLLDHLILTDERCYSFADQGWPDM